MCNPALLAAVPAAAGAVQSGFQAGADAVSLEMQATGEEAAANERARRLRAQGMEFLAEQRLQQLSSGVEGGTGSALEVAEKDAGEIELDALTELYGGVSRGAAMREKARLTRENSPHGLMKKVMRGATDIIHGQPVWNALGAGTQPLNRIHQGAHKRSNKTIWGY